MTEESATEQVRVLASEIVHQLATEYYESLRAARGPVSDFVDAVKRFRNDGFTIIDLPPGACAKFDMSEPNEFGNYWLVNFPLWTREDGESDLHLYLVFQPEDGALAGYVDDIYVP